MKRSRRSCCSKEYDVVILDEANVAAHYGLITVQELLDCIRDKPKNVELVITGRYANDAVMEAADLVTEMREIKHYRQTGSRGAAWNRKIKNCGPGTRREPARQQRPRQRRCVGRCGVRGMRSAECGVEAKRRPWKYPFLTEAECPSSFTAQVSGCRTERLLPRSLRTPGTIPM